MATPKIEIAAERIAEGRRLYELTLTPVPDIAAMMGVSRRTLARRIDEWGWVPRAAPRHTTDRAFVAAAPDVAAVGADAGAVIAVSDPDQLHIANAMRIQTTVELTLDALQRVLDKVGPADEGGTERSARTLAAVARTLQEMAPLTKPDEMAAPDWSLCHGNPNHSLEVGVCPGYGTGGMAGAADWRRAAYDKILSLDWSRVENVVQRLQAILTLAEQAKILRILRERREHLAQYFEL